MFKKIVSAVLAACLLYHVLPTAMAAEKQHMFVSFNETQIEKTGLELIPGWSSGLVGKAKDMLAPYGFVEHTQMRSDAKNRFDGKLEIFIQTLCEFCQYDNPKHIIDDNVQYIIEHLSDLSDAMRNDIKTAYQHNLEKADRLGNVPLKGSVYPCYAFAQTDPEWGAVLYPQYNGDTRTIFTSACGPTAMSTILSNWFHREILPTELAAYSVAHGFRLAYGTSEKLFSSAAAAYKMPTPVTVSSEKVNAVYQGIRDNGNMAIASMQYGHFTHGGHFVVLVGAKEINGTEYFLVADPNYPNKRYFNLGSDMIDENPDDPFVWAKQSIFKSESPELYWFQCDFRLPTPDYQATTNETLSQ